MRIINNERARHNGPDPQRRTRPAGFHLILAGLLLGALLVSGPGCGKGGDTETDHGPANENQAATDQTVARQVGSLRIDAAGWRSFRALGDQITSGEPRTLEELSALGDQASFRFWRNCQKPTPPQASRVGRWLEVAFRSELDRTDPKKETRVPRTMGASYQYSYRFAESVDRQVQEWSDPEHQANFLARAHRWVNPASLPDPLTIHFLPTLPELLYCSGELIVDTGVLVAGGNRQLEGQLIALLYRNLQAIPFPGNQDSTGESSVANTFRILQNEGIPAWIENLPFTVFRPDHHSLHRVDLVPENFFRAGVRTIQFMNRHLPEMFSDPGIMGSKGPDFRGEAGEGAAPALAGYALAATIVHQLGEERLLEVRNSVPGFLAAYQEAALRNPDPRPEWGATGIQLPEAMPPLDPKVFSKVQELLLREYSR